MSWILITLNWYVVLFFLGVIFFPLTRRIFGRFFPDFGYAFAKTLAILFLSYAIFVAGLLKFLPFSQTSLILLIAISTIINVLILFRKKQSTINNQQLSFLLIFFEELFFLAALFFWAFVRGQEPSVRGLEKFMDFGFINSILRTQYFPPLDMWLSADSINPQGYSINYYYFGHLTGATLIKLVGVKPAIGYNLILATVFALSLTQAFSLIVGIIYNSIHSIKDKVIHHLSLAKMIIFGLLGSYIINLGGNLHTIYAFSSGYPNENPIPFWKILSWYNPTKYWYPNATRFIPFTIHEFPSYSWVVADMHGHVYDIPFVLLTLAVLFIFLLKHYRKDKLLTINYQLLTIIFLGFLTAVHYMTNAFDGPIYILLSIIILFLIYKLTWQFILNVLLLIGSFIVFVLPFSIHFKPFVTGIGVNCSPGFLVNLKKLGPFLFEKGNCQASPIWMIFILWGFFWASFVLFYLVKRLTKELDNNETMIQCDNFILVLFSLGTFLIIIPEFFYIKDIYPAHFRANTMFKMGYQAFIIMGVASSYTFFKIGFLDKINTRIFRLIFLFFFFFIAIYPMFSIPSYYGQLNRKVELDGSVWLTNTFPEDKEIIDYLNSNVKGQPVILEAQGDSYTDFERISAYTGLPTVAGWWVHEWLWRGSADVVGKKIPDIVNIFESTDIELSLQLLRKYHVSFIIVSKMERQKYPNLKLDKIEKISQRIFQSTNGDGAIYKVNF